VTRAETSSFAEEGNHTIQPTAVAVNAHESVCGDSAIEERVEFALDEVWHAAFLDPRMRQPRRPGYRQTNAVQRHEGIEVLDPAGVSVDLEQGQHPVQSVGAFEPAGGFDRHRTLV
jgi:hypothetical protein